MTNNLKQAELNISTEIKELFAVVLKNKRTLILSTTIAVLTGVFIVIFTPRLYKTEVSLLAESGSSNSLGSMGQLGNLSGLDMGNLIGMDMGNTGNNALTPEVYPEVVKSTSFLLEILQQEVYLKKEDLTVTMSEYLQDYTKPNISGWPGYLLNIFKSKKQKSAIPTMEKGKPLDISLEYDALIKSLSGMIEMEVIKSESGLTGGKVKMIKVNVEQQDPYVSAMLTEKIISCLKQYIVDYNTNKVKDDLEFIQGRYNDAQAKYYAAQKALADYDDSNVNVVLASAKTERDRLVTESTLASNLYKSLAQKLEQAKILVQDRTPVFTVIEPAKVPLRKSKPRTIFTIFSLAIIGLFIGTCIVIWKEFIQPRNIIS